jgi:predicted nucleotidyltransferase
MNFIENHIKTITKLCKAHNIKPFCAFDSVLNDKFNSESDVDLVVYFQPIDVLDYGDNYYDLKFSLEKNFKKS